jgi:hypothetical protein
LAGDLRAIHEARVQPIKEQETGVWATLGQFYIENWASHPGNAGWTGLGKPRGRIVQSKGWWMRKREGVTRVIEWHSAFGQESSSFVRDSWALWKRLDSTKDLVITNWIGKSKRKFKTRVLERQLQTEPDVRSLVLTY